MKPQNLLILMSDQHTRSVTGSYGHPVVHTPNLDAIAEKGSRFENAYCNVPICVPSRASFATGRYAHKIGSWDNAKPYTGHEAESWGHRLSKQGHNVTTIGKLHYRLESDPTGFSDQRLPMHVVDGVGDVHSLLRADMPVRDSARKVVLEAGPGETGYIHYDRAVAKASIDWLRNEARGHDNPWALFVSFVTPHFPLVVPQQYLDLYPPESVPMPVQWAQADWPEHPVIKFHRHIGGFDAPLNERTTRNAISAYFGLVSFMDEQVGRVLDALHVAGLDGETRIIYVSDHGEMLGNRGLWGKCTLYDEAVGVPLILSGESVPEGKVVNTNVSLVDIFPTTVEAVGASCTPEDSDLPGESLWDLARGQDRERSIFSEYHAVYSPSGGFMLRTDRYKYTYYVGYTPQLFDMHKDPLELNDLAGNTSYNELISDLDQLLRTLVDPEEVDREARMDQERRLELSGGRETVLNEGPRIAYTPAPTQLEPN